MADKRPLLTNLPTSASTFIGRGVELAEIHALVGGSRLVTLTGTGGAGKTRLALQVAAGLADRTDDGVWFADLAPLADPGLVGLTVADVLGVRPPSGRPVLDTVAEAVGGRSCGDFALGRHCTRPDPAVIAFPRPAEVPSGLPAGPDAIGGRSYL